MSRNPPQRRKARARNGVAPYSPAALSPGCEKRRKRRARGGVTGTVAASLPLTLRQPGMETRCPKGRAGTAQLARCEA
ncbi:hypothetical protein PJP40_004570 [Salmonella enterica]|nr:hypothetical protein [Salmonella enterica]